MESAYARPIEQVLSTFDVEPETGLTDAQVVALREKHGSNCMFPLSSRDISSLLRR